MERLQTISSLILMLTLFKYSNCVLTQECQTVVKVDPYLGVDCSNIDLSLVNYTCDDLEDVLMSVSAQRTTHELGGCIAVNIYPGDYVINSFIRISQNFVLTGSSNVSVTFDFHSIYDARTAQRPYYLISFANSDHASISNIDFYDSPGIIGFDNVSNILIHTSSFRYFFQGAVDIYNSPFVTVTGSTFEHNGPVAIVKNESYRGHSGGLSVGYNDIAEREGGLIQISNCTFRNNTSNPSAAVQQSTTQLLQRFVFAGRGGGCAITVNSTFNLSASIESSYFEENSALSFGGGLYIGFSAYSPHTVTVMRSRFVNNSCNSSAGGLQFGFIEALTSSITLILESSEFIQNSAQFGGGVHLFALGTTNSGGELTNFARIYNCTFQENRGVEFGAAISMTSLLFLTNSENARPLEIVDSSFVSNQGGRGGTVCSAFLPVSFGGVTTFEKNRGRTLVVLSALVTIAGQVSFIANDGVGIDGGAIFATSFGQLRLLSGGSLNFTDNRGVLGASIVVDYHTAIPPVYARLPFNPLCALLGENSTQNPDEWENVSISFSGNDAVVASGVFLNNLDLCAWVHLQNPSFDRQRVFRWNFVSFSDNNYNSLHGSDGFNPEWYVQTPATSIATITRSVEVFPGEQFQLDITAEDELERPTATVIRLSNAQGNSFITPAAVTVDHVENGISSINVSFFSDSRETQFQTVHNFSVQTLLEEQIRRDTFSVVSSDCPAGYKLSEASVVGATACECNFENPNILDCRGRNILFAERLWGTSSMQAKDDFLYTYPCPVYYCRCFPETAAEMTVCINIFNDANPDKQCSCDREGILCGNCKNGTGVSVLLNKCVTCGRSSGLLVAAVIVLDIIVLVAVMRFIRIPPPSWLYPCLFYVQILPYLTEHFPVTFEVLIPYVHYVSSGLSFYFVYDFCLYPEMNALVSYFLRYLPFLISIIIAPAVFMRHYFLKLHTSPWYGLWWVVLLQFTHVVHTSVSILNCPSIPDRAGSQGPLWYVNANISCFKNGHLPISLLAIFVVAFAVLLTILVWLYSIKKLRRPQWFGSSVESLSLAFTEKCPWWPGVELGRRIIIILAIIIFPGNIYPTLIILSTSMVVFGILQPYKQKIPVIIEMVIAVDIIVLLLLRNTKQIQDDLQTLRIHNKTAGSEDGCSSEIEGITRLTVLLLPFFYFPLAMLLVCIAISLIVISWKLVCMKSSTVEGALLDDSLTADHVYNLMLQDASHTTFVEIESSDSGDDTDDVIATALVESTAN